MKKFRFSIGFDYFNKYTFNSGHAGFYEDFWFKSSSCAGRYLKKVVFKNYPLDTFNIKNLEAPCYIMKVNVPKGKMKQDFKIWLLTRSPLENVLSFIFHKTEKTSLIYKLARYVLSWCISWNK